MKRQPRKRAGSLPEAEAPKRGTDFRRKCGGSSVVPLSSGTTSAALSMSSDLVPSPGNRQTIRLAADQPETVGGEAASELVELASGTVQRERTLRQQNAEVQREFLASHLGVEMGRVKPCVAVMGRVPEGRRQEFCRVLVIDFLRAGATEEAIRGHMGLYVESQCEQPPFASHAFTHREASDTIKAVLAKAKRERIRGYGCINPTNPLLEFCLFRENYKACPYVRGMLRQPKREGISTLLGALNLLASHRVSGHWTERQRNRRALLHWTIAALEQAKGYGGAELITSEEELVCYFPGPITRRTVRGDLMAMAEARQIRWMPGKSRRGRAGEPSIGMRIIRLFPPDRESMRAVLEVFPGAQEVDR